MRNILLPNIFPMALLGLALGSRSNPGDTHEYFCPPDMVPIVGEAMNSSTGLGEWLQDMTCTSWISKEFPARCASFDPALWREKSSTVPRHRMQFCIDNYEWPNRVGENPKVYVTWLEARDSCLSVGKRLCDEEEWTFACEGEEGTPYPYGYERNPEECGLDRPWIKPNNSLLLRDNKAAKNELARLWQGSPSGARPRCKSPFGVEDMTGNVDEWTTSTHHDGNVSIMKGGYWGPVRARCRPSTRIHNEWHRYYQQGFRCCKSL